MSSKLRYAGLLPGIVAIAVLAALGGPSGADNGQWQTAGFCENFSLQTGQVPYWACDQFELSECVYCKNGIYPTFQSTKNSNLLVMKDGQYDCFSKERLVGICLEGDCVAKIADYHCETYPDKYKVQPTEPPGG